MLRNHISRLFLALALAVAEIVGVCACSTPAVTSVGSGSGGDSPPAAQLTAADDNGQVLTALTFSDADLATVHVANTGTAGSQPLSISLTGAAAANFAIDPATTCAQLTLAVGEHCDVVVRYQPMTADPATAELTISDADSSVLVGLRPITRPGVLIVISGGAAGDVSLADPQTGTLLGGCTATTDHATACLIRVAGGQSFAVTAATPSVYGGLSGACSTTTTSCTITVDAAIATVSASFTAIPDEQWALLPGGKRIMSAAYDSTNHLVVAADTVIKLSADGAVIWRQPIAACAVATGPGDTIYVETTANLIKLAPDGSQLWSQPLDSRAVGCGNTDDGFDGFVHNLAVGSDGAVAIHGNLGVARWDSDGNLSWSQPLNSLNEFGVAIDPSGNVAAAVQDNQGENLDLMVFDSTGTPGAEQDGISVTYHGMFIIDPTGRVIATSSGHSLTSALGHTVRIINDPDFAPNGICEAGTGDIAWLYETDDDESFGRDWILNRYHPDGSLAATFHNPPLPDIADIAFGTSPHDIAASPDGHVAIVGDFFGAAYSGGWIVQLAPSH